MRGVGVFFLAKYGFTALEPTGNPSVHPLSYLISFTSFSTLAVGVGGGSLMEASVACMAAWMADDGLAGCCGNVMLPAGGAATVVGGAAITGPASVLLNALKQAVTKIYTYKSKYYGWNSQVSLMLLNKE